MFLAASRLQCSVARICMRTASDTSRCGSVGIAPPPCRGPSRHGPGWRDRTPERPARLDDVRSWDVTKRENCSMSECAGMSLESQASVDRMKIFNLNSDEWDATRDREGWRCSGTGVGERIGGELLGATMSEIEPG